MPQYILRPDGVISNAWNLNGGATTAADALNGTAVQPTAGETTKAIATTTAGVVSEVTVGTVVLGGGESVTSVVLWEYGQADVAANSHNFQSFTGATALGSPTTVADSSAAGWRSQTYTGTLSQAQVDDLRMRFTEGAGGLGNNFAFEAYIELNTSISAGGGQVQNVGSDATVIQPSAYSVG